MRSTGTPAGPGGSQPLDSHAVGQEGYGDAGVGPHVCDDLVQEDAVGVDVAGLADVPRREELQG